MSDWRIGNGTKVLSPKVETKWGLSYARLALTTTVLILSGLAATGGFLWKVYHDGLNRTRADIQAAIDLETWAWRNRDEEIFLSRLDPRANRSWRLREEAMFRLYREQRPHETWEENATIKAVELRGDVAVVDVLVTRPDPFERRFRQTRFYRLINGRWLRTAPVAKLWGTQRIQETQHFRFLYRQRDEKAVKEVIGRIESFYRQVSQHFGAYALSDRKLIIDIGVLMPTIHHYNAGVSRISVLSPLLTGVPVDSSPALELRRALAYNLVYELMAPQPMPALDDYSPRSVLRNGILMWEVHQWAPWPPHREELRKRMLREALVEGKLIPLRDIGTAYRDAGRLRRDLASLEAEMVAGYIAAVYGQERLAEVLKASLGHEAWEELIPSLFDISYEDFEQRWGEYIEKLASTSSSLTTSNNANKTRHGLVQITEELGLTERRGFLKRAATFMVGLVFLPRFGSLREQGQRPAVVPPDEEHTPLERLVSLTKDDPLFKTLRQSSGVKAYEQASAERFGSLFWDQAARAIYQNTDAQALLVPIERSEESSDIRTLLTFYRERTGLAGTVIFEISPTEDASARSFSGVVSYYTPDGHLLTGATFEDNELISINSFPNTISIAGYWECVGECIDCAWDSLPWYLQIICGGSCGACIFSPNPVTCTACLACLAGIGVSCGTYCVGLDEYPGC